MSELAIHGGKPVRDKYLPYGRQWLDSNDIDNVLSVLKSDYLTTGPRLPEFEERLSGYTGARYAVAFSSGTAALHGASFAAGIQHGVEVITTPLTFAASSNCVLYQGGKPVFADVSLDSYNIDTEEIAKKITSKTGALIPVDFTGRPADMDEIIRLAEKNDLIVIEDGTHAPGAEYKGKKVGSLSDMTVFSFHPVKHLAMGEGGAVTTNDEGYFERLKLFRTHGITRNPDLLKNNHGPWYYEQHELGYNYRLTELQCALGLSQLEKLDEFVRKRREYADHYNQAFSAVDGIITPETADNINPSWHIYVIQLDLEKFKTDRKEIYEALQAENIGVNVHYIPVYYHPYYQKLGYERGLCPNAEFLYERFITLPLFPKMTGNDVNDVIEAVKKVVGYYLK
jgi:UDP-4-amino-4,6-dideoxy-N-acetyl-beta-L-altrosamine transaminase